jgi:hypothetical protein
MKGETYPRPTNATFRGLSASILSELFAKGLALLSTSLPPKDLQRLARADPTVEEGDEACPLAARSIC